MRRRPNTSRLGLETLEQRLVLAASFDPARPVIDGATYDDIDQQSSPTCAILSSLSAVAYNGGDLASRITYLGGDQYRVQLFHEGRPVHYQVGFDGNVTGDDPAMNGEEFWPILYQRAFLKYRSDHGDVLEDVGQLFNPGWAFTGTALSALTGQSYRKYGVDDSPQTELARIRSALDAGQPIVADVWGGSSIFNGPSTPRLATWHAYTIIDTYRDASGQDMILLRNPWGSDDGGHQIEASGPGNDTNDGIVSITLRDFVESMHDYYVGNVGGRFDMLVDTGLLEASKDSVADTIEIGSANGMPAVWVNGQLQRQVPASRINALYVRGSSANDIVTVRVGGIGVPVYLDAGYGVNTLTVAGSSSADTITANAGEIVLAASDTARIAHKGIGSVTINGMDGVDRITVNGTAGITTTVSGGNQGDVITLTGVVDRSITINGDVGADTITLAASTSSSYRITANGGADNDTFLVDTTAAITIAGEGGTGDTLRGPSVTSAWSLTGANAGTLNTSIRFSDVENLTGGSASDTFTVAVPSGTIALGTINGGNGSNTFSYASYSAAVTVDLTAQTATGTGGLRGFTTLVGSRSAGDRLVGPIANNNWNITGSNAGTINNYMTFSAFENLQAGPVLDTFRLAAAGRITGSIDAVLGDFPDVLDYSAWNGVTVDLTAGTAPGVTGRVTNFKNVIGSPGADTITGSALANILRGGGGSDTIRGAGGDDILLGEAGADRLEGGTGRDLLIGGLDGDTLVGGADDDILIGGTTSHDGHDGRLLDLMAEWTRSLSYQDRIRHLGSAQLVNPPISPRPTNTQPRQVLQVGEQGLNRSTYLASDTVFNDSAFDTLTGDGGRDWFWQDPGAATSLLLALRRDDSVTDADPILATREQVSRTNPPPPPLVIRVVSGPIVRPRVLRLV